jgi:hypothetical protein
MADSTVEVRLIITENALTLVPFSQHDGQEELIGPTIYLAHRLY